MGTGIFGISGGYIGFQLLPDNATQAQQYFYPAIGAFVGIIIGFWVVFGLIYLRNLLLAPIRQRNEARKLYDDLVRLSPKIAAQSKVFHNRAKLEIMNIGVDAEFTATFRVVEGVPPADLYTMCWEPISRPTQHIAHGGIASLLVGEISSDTIENENIILSVFRGGLALFILGESGRQRIGASTEKMIEIRKLNQQYPTMRTTYENKCIIEITITAVPSSTIPFKQRYSLEIDEHNQLWFFDEVKS